MFNWILWYHLSTLQKVGKKQWGRIPDELCSTLFERYRNWIILWALSFIEDKMLPIWIWIYFSNNQPQSVQGCSGQETKVHQITSIDFSKNPRQKLQIGYPKHRRSSWPGKLWSFIRTPVWSLMTWVLDLVNMQRIHWDVYQPESYVDCGWRNKTLTLTTTCNGIRRNRCAECSPVSRMFDSNFFGQSQLLCKVRGCWHVIHVHFDGLRLIWRGVPSPKSLQIYIYLERFITAKLTNSTRKPNKYNSTRQETNFFEVNLQPPAEKPML